MVDVVYPAGWFHVERDRVELFGMVYERIDQFPLATADADTIVRADHKHRRFRLEFLQELRALFEAFIIVDPYDRRGFILFAFDAYASLDGLPFACLTPPFGDGIIPGDDIDQHGIPSEHRVENLTAVWLPGGQPPQFHDTVDANAYMASDSSLDQWMRHEPTGVWAFSLPSKWNAFSGLYIFS